MNSNKRISILVGIIALLIILLAGSIGYIFANISNDNAISNKSSSKENTKVLKEIEALKILYDTKIADKTISYTEMQIQKDSIENLVLALENTKSDASTLLKYKNQYKNLETKMKILVNEIVDLKSKKSRIIFKKQAEVVQLTEDKPKVEIVSRVEATPIKKEISIVKTEVPSEKIEPKNSNVNPIKEVIVVTRSEATTKKADKFGKVTLSDVKAAAYISKSATKKVETNDASRANLIKISFTLDENMNAKAGEKLYYFQIINNKNNVMGKRVTEFFDNESLTYSFAKTFNYENQRLEVSQEFLSNSFEKGYYFVNIFDRDELVGTSSFLLK